MWKTGKLEITAKIERQLVLRGLQTVLRVAYNESLVNILKVSMIGAF
jgi:hypothetical protein